MSVRAFPAPKHTRPEGWEGPFCSWCGDKITAGRKDRGWHDGRGDEPNCIGEFRLHTDRAVQFAHVAKRDGLKCHGCGSEPMKWRRGGEVGQPVHDRNYNTLYVIRWCDVTRVTALEVEHTVPLWSVAHYEPDERRKFFGPDYLRLLGPCCHRPKTKAEAAARAKVKRLEKPKAPKGTIQGRLFGPSRGFDKGHRKLTSRNDLRKRTR